MVSVALADAVHRYQTECAPTLPAWFGSPDSFVAATFVPVTVPDVPAIDWAAANGSFAGGVVRARFSLTLPTAPLHPSTAIEYVVPDVALKVSALAFVEVEASSFEATALSE